MSLFATAGRGREVRGAVGRHHSELVGRDVDDPLRCFELRDLQAQRLVVRLGVAHLCVEVVELLLVLQQQRVEHDETEQDREHRADDERGHDAEVQPPRRGLVDNAELRPTLARCRRPSRLRGRH